jgi:hypothetical protein
LWSSDAMSAARRVPETDAEHVDRFTAYGQARARVAQHVHVVLRQRDRRVVIVVVIAEDRETRRAAPPTARARRAEAPNVLANRPR